MNVLLVSPSFPASFWSLDHALPIIGRRSLLPPLGLLTVAAMLPGDWHKRLVDVNVQPLTDDDLAWADCVFLGGLVIQWKNTQEIIARCRRAGKKIVAGGPLFTAAYALFQDVDHFVLNEAELTLPALVAELEHGSPKRIYRSREFADLRQTPSPLWELADLRHYAMASIQYSRGCPFDCDFCNVTATLGRKTRVKQAGQVIRELDDLYRAGWRERIFFVDDNLIGDKRSLRNELLPALTDWQRRHGFLPLCTQVSMNLADDPALTRAMVDAGFDIVFIGIESPDPASLEECRKAQNRHRDMIADVKTLQRAGLEVQGGFILGFDHDTPATFQQQVDFIQASGIVTAMVGQLQAAPRTRLKQRLSGEGRLQPAALGHNTDGHTNFIPRMGLETLRRGHAWVLETLYAAAAILPADQDVPARVSLPVAPPPPAIGGPQAHLPRRRALRPPGRRARRMLEAHGLDPLAQAPPAAARHPPGGDRPSPPPDVSTALRPHRLAQPRDCHREQSHPARHAHDGMIGRAEPTVRLPSIVDERQPVGYARGAPVTKIRIECSSHEIRHHHSRRCFRRSASRAWRQDAA